VPLPLTCYQVLATDIPAAESLKLTSSAIAGPSDPKQPPNLSTETPLKRDDWMLLPPTAPSIPSEIRKDTQVTDGSMTDDYGEAFGGQRTLGGGIDFFSTLGTDVRKKPRPERPDPNQVSCLRCLMLNCGLTRISA